MDQLSIENERLMFYRCVVSEATDLVLSGYGLGVIELDGLRNVIGV